MQNIMNKLSLLKETLQTSDIETLRYLLLADFKSFCDYIFFAIYNRKLTKCYRPAHENHIDIIQDALIDVHNMKTQFLNINVPPRFGKTTLIVLFICWTLANNASCNNIYASYNTTLAEAQTGKIREIITSYVFFEFISVGQT